MSDTDSGENFDAWRDGDLGLGAVVDIHGKMLKEPIQQGWPVRSLADAVAELDRDWQMLERYL